MAPSPSPARLWIAIAISLLGLAVHNLEEFGWRGLWAIEAALIPWLLLQVTLALLWWRVAAARRAAAVALLATALLQLVGGAIVSVLPLAILPFEPAQTTRHYVGHLALGLAQIPLLHAAWLASRREAPEPPDN